MRLFAIKHLSHRFPFIRCRCCDENERLDPLFIGRRNDSSCVGMCRQKHRAVGLLQCAPERCRIVTE